MTTVVTLPQYRALVARTMSEADLQRRVIERARYYNWRLMHPRSARKRKAEGEEKQQWNVPIQGDTGWPDLALAKVGRAPLFFELKSEAGDFRDGQQEWLAALGENAYCIRPHHLIDGTVDRLLA